MKTSLFTLLENVVTTFGKTIGPICNIMNDIFVEKVVISASLTKFNFPKISRKAPLKPDTIFEV